VIYRIHHGYGHPPDAALFLCVLVGVFLGVIALLVLDEWLQAKRYRKELERQSEAFRPYADCLLRFRQYEANRAGKLESEKVKP